MARLASAPFAFAIALAAPALLASCSGGGHHGGGASAAASATGVPPVPAQLAPVRAKTAVVLDREGEGFLEQDGGQLLLHVRGSTFERGRQYGALVGDRIDQILRQLPGFVQSQHFPAWLLPSVTYLTARLFENYFPSDVQDMMAGILAGNLQRRPQSIMSRDDLIFLNSLVDLGAITNGLIHCSSIAMWGPHTVDGKMFQTRCIDLFTGSGLENITLVTIEKGDGKVPFMNCGWCGMIGAISGMNAHGIGIGQVWAFSNDRNFGTPWGLTTRKIMEDGTTAADAVAAFQAEPHRTYGSNFVFGDKGDGPAGALRAYAIESSAHYMASFHDDDPAEDQALWQGQPYAIKIASAVFRGDSCMDPGMRSRQTASNGPSGDPRTANAYLRRYKGQADALAALEAGGHRLDAQDVIALTKQVATPGESLQCCVYANSDLEAWVANATLPPGVTPAPGAGADAFTQPYVHHDFNYYLPTVHAGLDATDYRAGGMQLVTVSWETLGCDRDLGLVLSCEGPAGAALSYAEFPAAIPLSFRAAAGQQTMSVAVRVPAGVSPGAWTLAARLYERGTSDLVDCSLVPFTAH
jgi:hypothetical protein